MADELHLPLSAEERERLAAEAKAHAQTPEEYAHTLVTEGISGRFARALASVRAELPALAAGEAPETVHRSTLPGDEAPMSSRDLRDRSAA
ncbi:hypothetical protein [Streptomyces sp. NBC_01455]|uniref:hypothetical protein n=1 Tax=Streptomyces sp. NBC_01455 TaxID=2903874 RepID=UPI002E33355E|nr:hypothetical protein [Streptomyces sp. NBC_01455]